MRRESDATPQRLKPLAPMRPRKPRVPLLPIVDDRRRVMAVGMVCAGLLAVVLGVPGSGVADATAQVGDAKALSSPVGLWTTIDDETRQPKASVRVSESAGVLTGRIEKLIAPSRPNPACDACEGDRKGKPIEGMDFLTGLKPSEDGSGWEGGEILDPNNGKVYRARAKLVDGGRRLEVRGFVGVALFGRTQTWIRD